jgi:serine/threonine-protein kinase PRP4
MRAHTRIAGKILYPGRSNNEMLRMQMEAMGPFPRKMLRKSKFWQRHFNTQTFYFQQICIDEVSQQVRHTHNTHTKRTPTTAHLTACHTQEYVKEVNVVKPVRDLKAELQRAATAEDVAHAGQLADLMLKCLCLDPAKRISPEVALAHPFLKP